MNDFDEDVGPLAEYQCISSPYVESVIEEKNNVIIVTTPQYKSLLVDYFRYFNLRLRLNDIFQILLDTIWCRCIQSSDTENDQEFSCNHRSIYSSISLLLLVRGVFDNHRVQRNILNGIMYEYQIDRLLSHRKQ